MRARKLVATVVASLAVPAALAAPAVARPPAAPAAACDPMGTEPVYRGKVPSPKDVLGFDLGERQVGVAESDRYLETVAAKSDRVISGTLATTARGRPLRYAVVGRPELLSKAGLARVRRDAGRLRDPSTPEHLARRITERGVPILWVSGNVHGNEPSGTDAALKVLRDLGDRTDCAATTILTNALVIVLPSQNPDGREAGTRQNSYGFDMNRDWFARTQPETDGKLALLNEYPPALYIDAHEMGGDSYFFPPNADPIYHETPEQAIGWINDLYGAAMAAEFRRQGIDFFNRDVYDLFYQGYGDSVPTTAFHAAGMTFEKGAVSPYPERVREQYLTQWVTLSAAARNRQDVLSKWRRMTVDAHEQGETGKLEPNQIYNPPNQIDRPVPDRKVRSYFLRDDDPAKRAEVRLIVRRLLRMGVRVEKLVKPLTVPDLKAYGRPEAKATLPAGTYWISMAQGQKHWIQAMLNEDAYTPFPYFYDVTAWSLPLLGNVSGGSSGAVLRPRAVPVGTPPAPRPRHDGKAPKIGVLQLSDTSSAFESTGWLRHRLDREWKLPFTLLSAADVAAGRLAGIEVLVAPNGSAKIAHEALGDTGRAALREWTRDGGRYVGWQGGTELAALLGLTTATLAEPTSDIPGTLLRVKVDGASPLSKGVGATAWNFTSYDLVMRASSGVVVSYPRPDSPDWFVSGFERGAAELGGTAAVVDQPVGAGRSVLFAAEPNFRAFTDGTAKLLANAILGPDPAGAQAPRADATAKAAQQAAALPSYESPIRVSVKTADAAKAAAVLRSVGAAWAERRGGDVVHYVIDNPRGLPTDHHPFAGRLPSLIRKAGIAPIAVTLP
ncbi:RNase H-fold protein (predicted Holliday junction resolvase) [Actinomadura pelletieri DSM 43383]|uniref:RNase H-fold protein (Predicted Holliday junction resolvase) n=1 Tax=Actinomadura pelletieri DSM 43383 TaxID=1120940 RepID=A0A495QPR4_9ACTN|nr:M14 family zinc carboxypeptidase [Actinomadura pelletieri]RKS74945.1 RNase H-fold protein (predicted Holliday junction resolvase) [Actinomadura pelletieri DSM 43383]